MQTVFQILLVPVFLVTVPAWFMAVYYMFKTVANRRRGIGLWDAPSRNPFNHILFEKNLTQEGLKYRRRLCWAVLLFVGPILTMLAIGAITGQLNH